MKVMVIGLRGFPGVQGGVEAHAENLYPLMVRLGCSVEVVVRKEYMPKEFVGCWRGVRFLPIWAPMGFMDGVETFFHSFWGVLLAGVKRPDILHIHSAGPALMTLLARGFGLRVVFTLHTHDYMREKWGRFGRLLLKWGERLGVRCSNNCIVVSRALAKSVQARYRRKPRYIPNGVKPPVFNHSKEVLNSFGLEEAKYVLMVSRLDPGKRQVDLIHAFTRAKLPGWKLVLVGGIEPENHYARHIQKLVKGAGNIVLTGFQGGDALGAIYEYAGLFVLPSAHEGFPLVLLEALSYGLSVLATRIPANLEFRLPRSQYFGVGDVERLSQLLQEYCYQVVHALDIAARVDTRVTRCFNWDEIALQTLKVYQKSHGKG